MNQFEAALQLYRASKPKKLAETQGLRIQSALVALGLDPSKVTIHGNMVFLEEGRLSLRFTGNLNQPLTLTVSCGIRESRPVEISLWGLGKALSEIDWAAKAA